MKTLFCLCLYSLFEIFFISSATADLIVLASPMSNDPYYSEVKEDIIDFQLAFAKLIEKPDEVLILTDKDLYNDYVKSFDPEKVVIAPISDIWMRDFSLTNPSDPVLFRYTAAGQGGGTYGQIKADEVQEKLLETLRQADLSYKETDLLNDGGNFVEDYEGNAVVSKKFLRDNHLTEKQGRNKIREIARLNHVAFIEADEQGGLEHADGVVSFIDSNTLIINSYPDNPEYSKQLKEDLKKGLPGVKIYEVVTPYDSSKIYDTRFGSACGLYTNALVTQDYVYLPQFGIAEDTVALEQVRNVTSRKVVPVPAHQVCHMGGGVRCMSWQVRGKNATQLLNYFAPPSKQINSFPQELFPFGELRQEYL